MPPKRAPAPKPTVRTSPYDLRKTHIPRISPPPAEGYKGNKKTNGAYIPRSATTQAAAIRRRAAASRAAAANTEIAAPGPSNTPRSTTPLKPRKTALPTRSSPASQKKVQFQLPAAQPASSDAPTTEDDTESNDDAESDDEGEEEEEGEEGEEGEEDNLPSIGDRDVDTDEEELAHKLYDAKEAYRKCIHDRHVYEARRRHPDGVLPREVETSDLESALQDAMMKADFPIGIFLNVRVNKKDQVRKSLVDSTRHTFDIGVIEKAFLNALHPVVRDEDYEVSVRRAIIKHSSGRGKATYHDFEDFDTANSEHILNILEKHHSRHRTGMVELHFEVLVDCEALSKAPKRPLQPGPPSDIPSSDITSSPPPIPRKKQSNSRTHRLQEQHATRLDTIRVAGNFQRQLMDRWCCNEPNCTNKDNFCFPEPLDRTKHYNITAPQHETWSNAISSGEATIQNPPINLLRYWEQQQGAINRLSRQPIRQTAAQQTKSAMERMADMQQQMQEQMMQARMFDQMEAMEEKQERREERNERRRMQQDQRDLASYPRYPLPAPPLPFQYPGMPYSAGQPLTSPQTYNTRQGCVMSPQLPQARPQSSSPINDTADEYDTLDSFFYWKVINTNSPERRYKWEQVKEIVFQHDWTIQDLKDMEDDKSAIYQRAIKAGISDGFARLFRRELQRHKGEVQHQQRVREQEVQAISALGQLGGAMEGGGFMTPT